MNRPPVRLNTHCCTRCDFRSFRFFAVRTGFFVNGSMAVWCVYGAISGEGRISLA